MLDMMDVIERINLVKCDAKMNGFEKSVLLLEDDLDRSSVARLILDDFRHELKNKEIFSELKDRASNIIFGNFECSYHPYLNIELCSISDVRPSLIIPDEFKNIRCVIQNEATEGIKNPQVVAIFPENFKGHEATEFDPVYYFVNKFSERHFAFTRPFLKQSQLREMFFKVIEADVNKIYKLIANWVHIHEFSHRKGIMPIPNYLKEKSGRYSAAMEELRADLEVINYCLEDGSDEAQLTALYVFGERLLAYPLFRSRTNFDAISSIIFWRFLKGNNFFLSPNINLLEKEVKGLIDLIRSVENKALAFESPQERRSCLNDFFKDYIGEPNEQFEKYHDFWERL